MIWSDQFQLCNGIEYLIDKPQREINGKDPNQLYKHEYQSQLLKIVDNLEELIIDLPIWPARIIRILL